MTLAALTLAGCGDEPNAAGPEVPIDSAFVDVLVDLQLADARAALDPDSLGRQRIADSLRAVALTRHGLDSAALGRRLRRLGAEPTIARATYDAVDETLGAERGSRRPY